MTDPAHERIYKSQRALKRKKHHTFIGTVLWISVGIGLGYFMF